MKEAMSHEINEDTLPSQEKTTSCNPIAPLKNLLSSFWAYLNLVVVPDTGSEYLHNALTVQENKKIGVYGILKSTGSFNTGQATV